MLRPLLASVALVALACSPGPRDAPDAHDEAPSRVAAASDAPRIDGAPRLHAVPLAAEAEAGRERRALPLRAGPDGHVAVAVVDHLGLPVDGIEVIGLDLDGRGEPPDWLHFTFAAETGPDGRALVPPKRQGERYAAALFDGRPAISTASEPTRIVLPPCGSLEIDLAGHPRATRVRFESLDGGRERVLPTAPRTTVRVDHVPTGIDLELGAMSRMQTVTATVTGPTEHGEVVRWRPEAAPLVTVRARLVDAAGAPRRGMAAALHGGGRSIVMRARDEVSGVVVGVVPEHEWVLRPGDTGLMRERDRFRDDAGLLQGDVRVPAVDGSGEVELGDVVMAQLPPLIHGRVVDATGEPVFGAKVRLVPMSGDPLHVASASPGPARQDSRERVLDSIRDCHDVSDEGGRFELRSRRWSRETLAELTFIDATTQGRGGASARATFVPTGGEIVLVLRKPGRLRVGLSAVPAPMRRDLDLRLQRRDGLDTVFERQPRRWRRGEEITVRVPPASYDAEIRYRRTRVALLEGVQVPSGRDCRDPRLDPLLLPIKSVTLLCPGGGSLASHGVSAWTEPSWPGAEAPVEIDRTSGTVAWFEHGVREHLFVAVGGHVPVDLAELRDGDVVELEARARFRLEFRGAEAPAPEARIQAVPVPGGSSDGPQLSRSLVREPDGSIWIELARGRKYALGVDPGVLELVRIIEDGGIEVAPISDAVRRWHGVEFTAPSSGDAIVLRPN